MIKLNGTEKLQEFFFKKCIIENPTFFGNPETHNLKFDHIKGLSYLNDKEYPIMFPPSLVDFVITLPKVKNTDYNFKGYITTKRTWLKDYLEKGVIINSMSGRDASQKYKLDVDYYKLMCSSKFTLTPTGDCPWSYRFFESIMCFSIPILEDNSNDVHHKMFKCYHHSDNHIYDEQIALENYNIFIDNFTTVSRK